MRAGSTSCCLFLLFPGRSAVSLSAWVAYASLSRPFFHCTPWLWVKKVSRRRCGAVQGQVSSPGSLSRQLLCAVLSTGVWASPCARGLTADRGREAVQRSVCLSWYCKDRACDGEEETTSAETVRWEGWGSWET